MRAIFALNSTSIAALFLLIFFKLQQGCGFLAARPAPASRPPPPAARFAALGLDPGVQRRGALLVPFNGPDRWHPRMAAFPWRPDISTLAASRTFLSGCNIRSTLGALPRWYLILTIVLVAAGEEWLYRGYAIERLEAVTGTPWLAGIVSLAAFAAAHLPVWGLGVSLTTVVSGGILTALYIRQRDVVFLILAHVATDLCGLAAG